MSMARSFMSLRRLASRSVVLRMAMAWNRLMEVEGNKTDSREWRREGRKSMEQRSSRFYIGD
jgi:hypothetical protein